MYYTLKVGISTPVGIMYYTLKVGISTPVGIMYYTLKVGISTPVGTGRVLATMERKNVERMYTERLTKIL